MPSLESSVPLIYIYMYHITGFGFFSPNFVIQWLYESYSVLEPARLFVIISIIQIFGRAL